MLNSKEQRAIAVGDSKRLAIAKSNSVMPGGPPNNNPMNVEGGSGTEINAKSIYNDFDQKYAQMGSKILDPVNQPPSLLQKGEGAGKPMGQRLNGWAPYGMQPQPPASAFDMMAAQNYRGNSFMGMVGIPAQPASGAFPPAFPGSSGPPMMQGFRDVETAMNQMKPENSMSNKTPGANKRTIPRQTTKRA